MAKRILIVDDEEKLVNMVKLRLEKNGYEVAVAYDGEEALSKAQKEKPDLIVLDLNLPKIYGYKVCRTLKDDEECKHIPIIIFTARGQKTDKGVGEDIGADAYINKPFESAVLLAKIKELLKET